MISVLILFDIRDASQKRVAILDNIQFLEHAPPDAVRLTYVNMADRPAFDPRWLEHDVIVLDTTLLCWRWQPNFAELAGQLEWMANFTGLIAAIPQDEYDFAHVLDDWLAILRVRIIVSALGEGYRALLYPKMHNQAYFIDGLTGYVHPRRAAECTQRMVPQRQRSIDVMYRANNLPMWFGWLGHLKTRLGIEGARVLGATTLRTNISIRPEDTVLGDDWITFMGDSRSILGSESGSSVLDRRGEVARHIRALQSEYPDRSFEEIDQLAGGELTRFHFQAIGPRHLEAMMTGTVQVLVEGSYSGLLKPWDHYIPLQRDLSDLGRVVEWLGDPALVGGIAERAHAEFVESGAYGYDVFARTFLEVVGLFRSLSAPPTSSAPVMAAEAHA